MRSTKNRGSFHGTPGSQGSLTKKSPVKRSGFGKKGKNWHQDMKGKIESLEGAREEYKRAEFEIGEETRTYEVTEKRRKR